MLRDAGFPVQVVRVARAMGGVESHHHVRVGGYSDRAGALAARDELERKGHQGFLMGAPAR
jgi:hypothetical protein